MGSLAALSAYLDNMMLWTRKLLHDYPKAYFDEFIFDQAVHNYVLYLWPNQSDTLVHLFENDRAPVMTLGVVTDVPFDNSTFVVTNNHGGLVNIVHQYDRHEMLQMAWDRIFTFVDAIQTLPFKSYRRVASAE